VDSPLAEAAVIVALILANGYLALAEIAVVSARPERLKGAVQQGSRSARAALALVEDPARLLATVQVGITLVGILSGAIAGVTLAERLADICRRWPALAHHAEGYSVAVVVGAITLVSLILGELVPKQIGLNAPERVAAFVARPMGALARLASPVVWVLTALTRATLAAIGVREKPEPTLTDHELRILVDEGTRAGQFAPAERDLIDRALDLHDLDLRFIMTPRSRVVTVNESDPPAAILQRIIESGYSRFPVVGGEGDDIRGVLHVKHFLGRCLHGPPAGVTECVQPALIVPETVSALDLLSRFSAERTHMAIVVDEHGQFAGAVTLDDVLEVLLGSVVLAERPVADPEVVRRADGSYLIDGALALPEFRRLVGLREPLAVERTQTTVTGLVTAALGRLPVLGDVAYAHGFRLEVIDMDGSRLDKVLVTPANPTDEGRP